MNNDLTKAIKLAEVASEQLLKSHVKQYTRSNGTVVQEHEDSRQKQAPPQADSNRHNWDDLDDDENPKYALQSSHLTSKTLSNIARGKEDLQHRAKQELAARGVDEHGKWLGFDKAAQHHGVKTKQKNDDLDEQLQVTHHKVLGALASGHIDGKRLAREQLANRGHDHEGNWIGFDKAAKLHKV